MSVADLCGRSFLLPTTSERQSLLYSEFNPAPICLVCRHPMSCDRLPASTTDLIFPSSLESLNLDDSFSLHGRRSRFLDLISFPDIDCLLHGTQSSFPNCLSSPNGGLASISMDLQVMLDNFQFLRRNYLSSPLFFVSRDFHFYLLLSP